MRWRAYRFAMRLMHRFNLHHTRAIGPLEDGRTLHRCEWCGVHRVETPMSVILADMRREAGGSR